MIHCLTLNIYLIKEAFTVNKTVSSSNKLKQRRDVNKTVMALYTVL